MPAHCWRKGGQVNEPKIMITGFSARRFDSVHALPFASLRVKSTASCPGVIGRVANDWNWSQRRASVLDGSSRGGAGVGVTVTVGVIAAVGVAAGVPVAVGAADWQAGSMASARRRRQDASRRWVIESVPPQLHSTTS